LPDLNLAYVRPGKFNLYGREDAPRFLRQQARRSHGGHKL